MGCSAGSNGADQVTGLDGIDRSAADTYRTVFGQAARTHATILTAHPCTADIAGRHVIGTGKSSPNAKFVSTSDHLLSGRIGAVFG
jgi:hypothetical protein